MKQTIYIFPSKFVIKKNGIAKNPYMDNLFNSFEKHFNIINRDRITKTGNLLDVFMLLHRKMDYIYFNWIESVASGKYGRIQYLLYHLLIFVLKIKKTKIIYLLHNKLTHGGSNLNDKITKSIINQANFTICHASDGIDFIKKINNNAKVTWFHHPFVDKNLAFKQNEKKYDILIWGSIEPYKGIYEFLQYLYDTNKVDNYKIMIIGKIKNSNYENKIFSFKSKHIIIENRIPDINEIEDYISKSKIVLFPYKPEYILSSGALMDSLAYGANIIGPSTGAFEDLFKLNLIKIYDNYSQLVILIDDLIENNITLYKEDDLISFIKMNLWSSYSLKVFNFINEDKN